MANDNFATYWRCTNENLLSDDDICTRCRPKKPNESNEIKMKIENDRKSMEANIFDWIFVLRGKSKQNHKQ